MSKLINKLFHKANTNYEVGLKVFDRATGKVDYFVLEKTIYQEWASEDMGYEILNVEKIYR